MSAAGLLLLLAACSSEAVEIDSPALDETTASACADLVDAVPDTLAGELRRPVTPKDAPGAAWGDDGQEPIVLTCGVDVPEDFDEYAHCIEFGGTGWFVPDEEIRDIASAAHASAMSHTPRVTVDIPGSQRDVGVDGVLVDLGKVIAEKLDETTPCH